MRGLIRFLVWTLILAGVVLGALWGIGVRTKRLPLNDPIFTVSLKPSLNEGDLILTQSISTPSYSDLVLCPEPGHEERYVIGRIIGEPGDKVEIKNGKPIVNGKTFTREHHCSESTFSYPNPNDEAEDFEQRCEWEEIAGALHMMGMPGGKIAPEDRQFDVPEEHYFLISDNRHFPYDSRDYGFVPIDSCKTTVMGRLVSKDGWGDSENRLNYIR